MQQTSSQAYLVIRHGTRWTDVFRLQTGDRITIGRSSENQIVIRDDRVSRVHAEICMPAGGWGVRDLGSRNGTLVSGQQVDGTRLLSDGDTIQIADCLMTFTTRLSDAFAGPMVTSSTSSSQITGEQATLEVDEAPLIVQRKHSTRWSGETVRSGRDEYSEASFLYSVTSELVKSSSIAQAAQLALDRLLHRMEISSGGIVLFDPPSQSSSLTIPAMAVVAARQENGQAYHRASDFLVSTVLKERQAVLARNVRDDASLSLARASGQKQTSSIICAPLRSSHEICGMLHVYSNLQEKMLTDDDLELAIAVADNLAMTLVSKQAEQQLTESLASSLRQINALQKELGQRCELVGHSAAIERVKQNILRAAPTQATILVRGESGVGKELVARAVHHSSKRSNGPLICLNCAALAPSLLESELFGHEKGAFTGATERKIGKFEAANGGTLLLDEIGEMSPDLQAKFLRVLEGHPFERLGGHQSIQVNVRIIAATNRDLEQAVREKLFRADLYFRLRVIEIDVPPLRQRKDDIPCLAEYFLDQFRQHADRRIVGFAPAAMECMCRHAWPGNVRELRNVVERGVVLGSAATIELDDLAIASLKLAAEVETTNTKPEVFVPKTLEEIEQAHILATLSATDGNKSRAAILLGIERSTLDRKLKRFRLDE